MFSKNVYEGRTTQERRPITIVHPEHFVLIHAITSGSRVGAPGARRPNGRRPMIYLLPIR